MDYNTIFSYKLNSKIRYKIFKNKKTIKFNTYYKYKTKKCLYIK